MVFFFCIERFFFKSVSIDSVQAILGKSFVCVHWMHICSQMFTESAKVCSSIPIHQWTKKIQFQFNGLRFNKYAKCVVDPNTSHSICGPLVTLIRPEKWQTYVYIYIQLVAYNLESIKVKWPRVHSLVRSKSNMQVIKCEQKTERVFRIRIKTLVGLTIWNTR